MHGLSCVRNRSRLIKESTAISALELQRRPLIKTFTYHEALKKHYRKKFKSMSTVFDKDRSLAWNSDWARYMVTNPDQLNVLDW